MGQGVASLIRHTFDFNTLVMCAFIQISLLLHAFGRNTRVVTCSTDGVTRTDPSYEGSARPHTTLRFHLLGRGLMHRHVKYMTERE